MFIIVSMWCLLFSLIILPIHSFLNNNAAFPIAIRIQNVEPFSTSLKSCCNTQSDDSNLFVCPATMGPLHKSVRYYGFAKEKYYSCSDNMRYKISDDYIDLTIPDEQEKPIWDLSLRELIGQRFFQNPFISGIYERGYRQNFENIGFPGIEKEYAEVEDFFLSGNASTVMDLCCGSGFMTRKLIGSQKFPQVLAGDLSPTMLAETKRRLQEENLPLPTLVRCDVSKLPLRSNSLDAIHAGAAMHCWPKINESLMEIYRVLKPGGLFYSSTFFSLTPLSAEQRRVGGFYYFESLAEIEGFLLAAGFGRENGGMLDVRKEGRGCAIIKARKAD